MRAWLLLLVVASCKKDDAPTCASAIAAMGPHLVPYRSDVSDAQRDEIRGTLSAALVERCREDRWSSTALDCMRRATSDTELEHCANHLLQRAQVDSLAQVLATRELHADLRVPAFKTTGIPECDRYWRAVIGLAECEAIPVETRRQMLAYLEENVSQWANLPPEGKAAAAPACAAAADATRQAAGVCK